MKRLRDNRGSTLVLVLVVLAIVGIFATIALAISLNNYQMKTTDAKTSDSFYSAEEIMDQIRAGLQTEVSDAMAMAYTDVMTNFSIDKSADERQEAFNVTYVNKLRQSLQGSSTVSNTCDISDTGLKRYIKASGTAVLKNSSGDEDYCLISTHEDYIVIKDLVLEYTDIKDYLSIIETDIVLNIPDMNLASTSALPSLFTFSMIGNGGVRFEEGANVLVRGSVYAGRADLVTADYYSMTEENRVSILAGTGATVNFEKMEEDINTGLIPDAYVVADGDVRVSSVADISTFDDVELWAQNILVGTQAYSTTGMTLSASMTLAGDTYVANDMVLDGASPRVNIGYKTDTLVDKGNYYGYGNNTTSKNTSSAIIINGKTPDSNTGDLVVPTLDMSQASKMVIAGYSYIGTGSIDGTDVVSGVTNSDVAMASSVAVKGDQIAYLVPAECVGVSKSSGKSLYHKNPLTYTEYNEILNNTSQYTMVDTSVTVKRLGRTLSEYTGSKAYPYQTVFVPARSGSDGLVYLYLDLDADDMRLYFNAYFATDSGSEKLKNYMDFYTNAISSPAASAQVYTAGLYASYSERSASLTYSKGKTASTYADLATMPATYENLTHYLMTQASSGAEKSLSNRVFDNTVKRSELESFLGASGRAYAQSGDAYVILVNNAGETDPFSFRDYCNSKGLDAAKNFLIIATGDVKIDADFTGSIIADGKVTVEPGVGTVKPAFDSDIRGVLNAELTGTSATRETYEFLVDGSGYLAASGLTAEAEESTVSVSDLITYENWAKR